MRGIIQRVFVLAAVAVAAAACGGDNESSPPARDGTTCSAEAIAADLDLSGQLLAATPTSTSCDGHWAIMVWDVPGDSQRLVRYVGTKWTTYVNFPHNVCWSNAAADGVPADLRHYFTSR
ncbi:hypothetical protein OG874_22960 [Nocardia sp. NBC_00565]|uniref:hypothetical protein n=1 Tax=Nocardia sp. NBC_00565 TaxID=2975993 RepID=UPI002E7FD3B3|nr:hypothetical protein [Nocardia sp. NBC_00565]WUB99795.1 hypothetical protein OG874_22960 [Nocardia sp. NBC_00565]